MLILTRKPGQSLYIGDDIKITIVEMKGHQIRVGIDAPRDYRIYREEIYLQILEENKSAAQASQENEMEGLEGLGRAWQGPGSSGDSGDEDAKPKGLGLSSSSFSGLKTTSSKKQKSASSKEKPQVVVKKKRPKNRNE